MNFFTENPLFATATEALGITILHSLWQGFLLLFLLALFLRFGKSTSSNIRFAVAFATLLIFLVAFGGTFYLQWINLAPPPIIELSADVPIEAVTVDTDEFIEATPEPITVMESSSNWETGLVRLTQLAPWLAWLWVAGSFVFALRLVNGLVQSQRLRYRTQPIPTDWQQRAKKLAEQLGINQTILFASTDRSNTPLTLGWLKPIVLIPGSLFTMMPTDQLEAILIHELAHIKRRDYLWNLIQSVAEVILFYHPAYWYISSVLERERELACDNLTVTVTRQPRIYAQALLQVAVRSNQVPLPSVAAAKKRGLSDRIQQITHPGRAQRGISALPFLLLLSMISLSLAAFSWYQPELNKSEGNLRSPDYIGYGQRYSFAINLPDQLASSSDEDYLIGQNNFDQKISSPWVYFRESTLYLLNGEVVDDPESIRMDAIHRFEVYYDPLPAPLQNLADKNYSTVVRAFSREYKPSNNKQPFSVSGQITTREEGKVQPVPGVKVEVKESGKQTITDAAGKFRMPATDEGTLIVNWPNKTVSELEINGREFFHLIAHTPKHRLEKYRDKLQKRLAERMSESALERDRKAIRREINALDKAINSLSPNNKTDSVDLSNFRLLDPANQPPLFVVNGVIQTNERSISALDPDNIASVEVLKEEEAQIWFGKEGDNGVVLIRTKNAPPPKVIKGNVFSGETQQPLAGVTLSIKGKELAVSDRNGYFRTEIPNYSPHFILSKDGYETIRHASNGYPSWPEKLYLRPVPPPGEITSLYQQFVVQEVSRTLYSINGLPHMNSDPIPKLTLKDIESIRVVNDRSKLRIPDRFDQIVHISTKASYQHTPISFSNANALYVIDGIVEENRNNLSDFQSGDIASTEVVKVKDNQNGQFDGLPVEGKVMVIFVTTKKSLSAKVISGTVFNSSTKQGVEGMKVTALNGATAITDEQGNYQISLPSTTQETVFEFTHPDYATRTIKINTHLESDIFLGISKDNDANGVIKTLTTEGIQKIRENRKVEGKIVDDETHEPIPNVAIGWTEDGDNTIITRTNEQGEYQLTLPKDVKVVEYSHPDYQEHFMRDEWITPFSQIVVGMKKLKAAQYRNTESDKGNLLEADPPHSLDSIGQSPLYIIDGIPQKDRTDLSDIQPEDIASITTMKVKGNRADQFEGLPIEGKDQVAFVTTKDAFPLDKITEETDSVNFSNFRLLDPADQPPILIIDGVIYREEEFPEDLAPKDIKSIETVKNAEAQKRYGKEAIGGAVLITTKNSPAFKTVEGRITDEESGKPLMGVYVSGRGTIIGTETDINGNYRISVPKKTKELKISHDGYASGGAIIGSREAVNVALLRDPFIDLENALFIIDGKIRKDIHSFDAVEALNLDIISTQTFTGDDRWMSLPLEYRKQGYTKLVRVFTSDFKEHLVGRTVQGKLVATGSEKPLAGAKISGLRNGEKTLLTRTNERGEYKVTLPEDVETVEYSYPGYNSIVLLDRRLLQSIPMAWTLYLRKEELPDKAPTFNKQLIVSPNPGGDKINVKFTLEQPFVVAFEILDKEGKVLHSEKHRYLDPGSKEVSIPTARFPANVYLLRVSVDNFSITRRVILE